MSAVSAAWTCEPGRRRRARATKRSNTSILERRDRVGAVSRKGTRRPLASSKLAADIEICAVVCPSLFFLEAPSARVPSLSRTRRSARRPESVLFGTERGSQENGGVRSWSEKIEIRAAPSSLFNVRRGHCQERSFFIFILEGTRTEKVFILGKKAVGANQMVFFFGRIVAVLALPHWCLSLLPT